MSLGEGRHRNSSYYVRCPRCKNGPMSCRCNPPFSSGCGSCRSSRYPRCRSCGKGRIGCVCRDPQFSQGLRFFMSPEEQIRADHKNIADEQLQHMHIETRHNQEDEIRRQQLEINKLQNALQRTPEWAAIAQAKKELQPLKDDLRKTNSELTLANRFFT